LGRKAARAAPKVMVVAAPGAAARTVVRCCRAAGAPGSTHGRKAGRGVGLRADRRGHRRRV